MLAISGIGAATLEKDIGWIPITDYGTCLVSGVPDHTSALEILKNLGQIHGIIDG